MNDSLPVPSELGLAPYLGVGFARRAAAQVFDLIIFDVLGLILSSITGIFVALYGIVRGIPQPVMSAKLLASSPYSTMAFYIAFLIGYLFYHAICEGIYGATLGKLIFKLCVISEEGKAATMGSAFIRSLAFYVDILFFGLVAALSMRSSKLQQRLGDKWAKTVVIKRSSTNPYPWPSGWKFIAAFLFAIVIYGCIITVYLVLKIL